MCVADVPMPSASMARRPSSRTSRVVGRGVDAVGRDELRADPALAHRLEDVRVVVRDEVVGGVAVDADRVVEALVTFDELLDSDVAARPTAPSSASARSSSASESTRHRSRCPGGGAGLEDDRVADPGRRSRGPRPRWLAPVDCAVCDPDVAQRLLHRRLVAAEICRAHRRSRECRTPRARARRPSCAPRSSTRARRSRPCSARSAPPR